MESAQIRRYRILEILGSGGFGTVYRAEMLTETGLRREVALKVLNEQTAGNAEAARRLRDEARILSNLNHRGIVRVDDLLQLEDRWTMVMELVNGVDTERLLEGLGPLPLSVSLEIVSDVGMTLNAAYRSSGNDGKPLGLIHRDIKPANILVTATGGVKLLDFGVARAEIEDREAKTQQAFVMGSLPYLAPERYAFEDLHQGDVYSLGCVLYELLTNERFGRTRPSEKRHTNKVRQALHHLWEVLPSERREEVLQLLADTLTYDPQHRPSARRFSARTLELRRLVSGPDLTEWAEDKVVPILTAGRPPSGTDSLVGRVLTHNLSGESIEASLPDGPDERPTGPVPELPLETAPSEEIPRPLPARPEASQEVAAHTPTQTQTQPPPPIDEEPSSHWGAVVLGLGAALLAGVAIVLIAMSGVTPESTSPPDEDPDRPGLEEVLEQVGAEDPLLFEDDLFEDDPPAAETETPSRPAVIDPGVRVIERPPADDPPVETSEASTSTPSKDPPTKPVRPRPAEPVPVIPTGQVVVTGDAEIIQLRGAGGTARPGDVPVGQWTVFPSFPGGYTVRGPTITVVEGQTLRLQCTSSERTCSIQ